jgi:Protein of unknown function (DUF2752)
MVPGHERMDRPKNAPPESLRFWVRGLLLLNVAVLVGVFGVAAWLKPYDADGVPLRMASHTQLGMAPCNFAVWFGRPCPTCGMTTSFALLAHGDVLASLRANPAGTILAVGLLVFVPWSLWASMRGRWPLRRWVEPYMIWGLVATLAVAVGRWIVIVGVPWISGRG